MTFPQYPQYPQRPQQQNPQQNPQQPSQYQQYPQQPQYPQPQVNPYELWLKRVKSVFSRIGAGMCLMVVIWYALAMVLSGVLYQVLHATNTAELGGVCGVGCPFVSRGHAARGTDHGQIFGH